MKLFAIFSALTLGCLVQATPLSTATGKDAPILTKTEFSTTKEATLSAALANHGGIHTNVPTSPINTETTSLAQASSLEKRQVNPVMVFCSSFNCGGACFAYTLIGDPLNTCFVPPVPNPFYSFFISNPSGVELLFQVGVAANLGCNFMSIVPETNFCFNIAPFGQSWAVFPTGVTF